MVLRGARTGCGSVQRKDCWFAARVRIAGAVVEPVQPLFD